MSPRNVAILLVVGLFGSCVGCAARSVVLEAAYDPTVGGDGWRVMGAELIDNRDMLAGLAIVQADVAECLGIEPGDPPAAFYTAAGITFRATTDRWDLADGLTLRKSRIVYVVRPRSPMDRSRAARTLRHELIHLLTQMPHPEVDESIKQCDNPDWRALR